MKKSSWAQKQIAYRQLDHQKKGIELALMQVELNLNPYSSGPVWLLRDNLHAELELIKEQRKALDELVTKPKRFWSPWIVAIYNWSTKDRFTFD